jgi:hypothetical protein
VDWKRQFKDWKLAVALALIFALCGGEAAPHFELLPAEYGPTTVASLQVSGGQTPNTAPGMYSYSWNSNHPWTT